MIPPRLYKGLFAALLLAGSMDIFAQPALDAASGKALFDKIWVPAPSSTTASDGLGPYYNARSCNQCHPGGGRGTREQSLAIHINDPVYGRQLQKYALPGLVPEAGISWSNTSLTVSLPGAKVELVKPVPFVTNLQYGAMSDRELSPRLAPSLYGVGLLEKIPEEILRALADEDDSDGDGISGRLNGIGRFGWKAGKESLGTQIGEALALDLGIGNPLFPSAYGDCTPVQKACLGLPNGNSPQHENLEASSTVMGLLLTYVSRLPAPGPVDLASESAGEGARVFNRLGCAGCHVPEFEVEGAKIRPYTDLLLHDMGEGLADGLTEGEAAGSEWRTAPLWGLGRTRNYLHDGRAATLEEAVLWHGGEAELAARRFRDLSKTARNDLIRFLNSL